MIPMNEQHYRCWYYLHPHFLAEMLQVQNLRVAGETEVEDAEQA